MSIVIIGYGVVGQNMHKVFPEAVLHDPVKGFTATGKYDIGFVCVPTEMLPNGQADLSIIRAVAAEWKTECRVVCIKSTVPPGTTAELGYNLIFSPEYFGATQHAGTVDYDYVILGGRKPCCDIVAEVYKEKYSAQLKIVYTTSRNAELTKYMDNCWLATKVTFCNEFYRIAKSYGSNYNELRELWLMDPRINRSHTFVYEDHPYYDSHCLNKDVPAIVHASPHRPSLLSAVLRTNDLHRSKK